VKIVGQTGFDSLGKTFQRIWRQEGVFGLFKGNGVNIMRIVPYSAMQFASYELFLKVNNQQRSSHTDFDRSSSVVKVVVTYKPGKD
jgi:hypothetical protein